MSVKIDDDLLKFSEKMSDMGSMSSTLSNLTSKLDEVKSASDSATANLSSVYQGAGLASILSAFASIDAAVTGIKASVDDGPKKAITLSEKLVTDINELKKLEQEINNKSTEDTSTDNRESEFKTKHDACKTKLSELKSLNPTIDITVKAQEVSTTVDTGTGEVRADLQGLQEGKVNKVVYTGKNGRAITSYIYLPVGASKTEGLGVTLHLGGDASKRENGGALSAGVGRDLSNGSQYSGIVVVLEAEDDKSYSDQNYLATAKELSDNVVKTYNCDANKISISGYSYGTYGAEKLITRYPNYFSQAIILAGGHGVSGGSTKIHYVMGTNDNLFKQNDSIFRGLASRDPNITYQAVSGDHGINYFAHRPITVNGVTYSNYIEFCLAQRKA